MILKPIVRPLPNKNLYELVTAFHTIIDGIEVDIPEGFIFDGASVPRFLWSIIGSPYLPQYIGAGLVHDYLYRTGIVSRKKADQIFYDLLRDNKVSKFYARKMYWGVRFGGWKAWNKHRKNDTK